MRRVVPRIEKMLDANTTVIAETGDSWFNGIKLNLPEGAGFESDCFDWRWLVSTHSPRIINHDSLSTQSDYFLKQ